MATYDVQSLCWNISPGHSIILKYMEDSHTWISMLFGLEQLSSGLHQPEMHNIEWLKLYQWLKGLYHQLILHMNKAMCFANPSGVELQRSKTSQVLRSNLKWSGKSCPLLLTSYQWWIIVLLTAPEALKTHPFVHACSWDSSWCTNWKVTVKYVSGQAHPKHCRIAVCWVCDDNAHCGPRL